MKIRVVSDGTPNGTCVLSATTGELVEGVVKVELVGTHTGFTGVLFIHNLEVDIDADLAVAPAERLEQPMELDQP